MKRAFKIRMTRGVHTALYLLVYSVNERADSERIGGDAGQFIRNDESEVSFRNVHMDELASTMQEWAAEIGAEGQIKEITGSAGSY